MQMSFITTHNMSIIRQGQAILHDISLDINPHDFITIIGPNGAGKSMLLKSLLGFFPPDKGSITRKPNLKIGYMPQYFTLEPTIPINVKHFICLAKNLARNSKNFDDIVTQTGIENYLPVHSSRFQAVRGNAFYWHGHCWIRPNYWC